MLNPTSYEAIGWLIVALAALLTIANQGMQFARNVRRPSGPEQRVIQEPLKVSEAPQFTTARECAERNAGLQKQINELKSMRQDDEIASSRHRKAIYDKIENIRTELGEKIESVRKELGDKVDDVSPSIVAQLLNTKQLWREGK